MISFEPSSKTLITLPLKVSIQNSNFKQNIAWDKSIIMVLQNSIIQISNSNFEENFSYDNGGVLWGDYKSTETVI